MPTYYVKKTGFDTDDGSSGDPWLTISHAEETMVAGDTVIVSPGTYARTWIQTAGTSGSLITYKAETSPVMSFDANGDASVSNSSSVTICGGFGIEVSYIRIEGFHIKDIGTASAGPWSTSPMSGIYLGRKWHNEVEPDYCEIVDNFIENLECNPNQGYGISGRGTYHNIDGNTFWQVEMSAIIIIGSNWTIENNDISHGNRHRTDNTIIANDTDGIRIFGTYHTIKNNYIHHFLLSDQIIDGSTWPHADAFQSFTYTTQYITIEGNMVYDIQNQFLQVSDDAGYTGTPDNINHWTFKNNIFIEAQNYGFYVHNMEYCVIVNNIFADCGYGPMYLADSSTNSVVKNNIFYRNGWKTSGETVDTITKSQLHIVPTGEGAVVDYNLVYPASETAFSTGHDENSVSGEDPLFVDGTNADPLLRDYHLQEGSPAINAGTDVSTYTTIDYEGNTRPLGLTDIGAYEYDSDTPTVIYIAFTV